MPDLILIVDDDGAFRQTLAAILTLKGHEPIEAATGQEALSRIKGDRCPAVALVDLRLPDMDGVALIGKIRKEAADKDHRGALACESEAGEGTIFRLELPTLP